MKPGIRTTEFWVTAGSVLVTGSTAVMAAVSAVQDQVSDDVAAVLGTVALIAMAAQAAGYSMSRARVKSTENELQMAIEQRREAGLVLRQIAETNAEDSNGS